MLAADGTKPAKVARRPSWPTKKPLDQAFSPRPKTFLQKGLRSAGGPKLLKWGLLGRGVKSAKVPPTPYVYYPPVYSNYQCYPCVLSCVVVLYCLHTSLPRVYVYAYVGTSKAWVHRGARGGYVALLDVLRRVGELCRVPRRRKSIRLRADPSSL